MKRIVWGTLNRFCAVMGILLERGMLRLVMIVAATLALYPTQNLAGLAGISSDNQSIQSRKKPQAQKRRLDYSRFSHDTHVLKQKLACDSCHKFPTANWKEVRKGDAAFADVAEFPEHQSCLNCHRQQFFARERPAPAICSNCHVKVTPRNTTRFLFDSLGDISDTSRPRRELISEFAVSFPHDKHADVVGAWLPARNPRSGFVSVSWQEKAGQQESAEPKSCPVCHQTYQPQGKSDDEYVTKPPEKLGDNFWLKKGTFKTIPNSHSVCFTCHNTDVGIEPAPSSCNACHKLAASHNPGKVDFDPNLFRTIGITDKTISATWSRRFSSGTFRHEGGEHPNINCVKCHNLPTMNTTEMKSLIVPVSSCGGAEGCHITATTDDGGILNYEIDQKKKEPAFVCTKCHISLGKQAVPASHVSAIPKPK